MSDALQSRLERQGAHRAMFAERWVTHRLEAMREAAEAAGFNNFEFARAVLHYGVEEMMWVGRDAELVDAAIEEATTLAAVVKANCQHPLEVSDQV
jgi:hypothetical protein